MNKKGISSIVIVLVIMLVLIAGGSGFYFGTTFNEPSKNNTTDNQGNNQGEIPTESQNSKYNFEIISKNDNSKLSVGDVVKLNTEEFYVVSSNNSETTLLSKYNLYVGQVIEEIDLDYVADYWYDSYKFIKMITKNDEGYGLQSSEAKGSTSMYGTYVGVVPFSGKTYWLNYEYDLKSKYTVDNIYDSSMSSIAMETGENNNHLTNNNKDYTIAYYVEEYVNTLKSYTNSSIKGRLLLESDLKKLGCVIEPISQQSCKCDNAPEWLFTSSYWLGSYAFGNERVGFFATSISYNSNIQEEDEEYDDEEYNIELATDYNDVRYYGVRPVIIINTSDIK